MWAILIFSVLLFSSCAHISKSRYDNRAMDVCQLKLDDFSAPENYDTSTLGNATEASLISDGELSMNWLCRTQDSACEARIMVDSFLESKGLTSNQMTPSLCPKVDRVSQALRNSAECHMRIGKVQEAFVQLDPLDANPVLNKCVSPVEKKEIQAQLIRFNSMGITI